MVTYREYHKGEARQITKYFYSQDQDMNLMRAEELIAFLQPEWYEIKRIRKTSTIIASSRMEGDG